MRRYLFFYALAGLMALACIRLGFWQLGRLSERRQSNALVEARLHQPAVSFAELPGDTAQARYRRVTLEGTYDLDYEFLLIGRSHNGSPGVYFVTPLRLAGTDTAVLVNRGWVYAPDAMTVDQSRWREPGPVRVTGFVQTFHPDGPGSSSVPDRPRSMRRTDPAPMAASLPYPIAGAYVVATAQAGDSAVRAARGDVLPVRLDPPPLDEGSHLSYAFQWFSFAAIAIAGAAVVYRNNRAQSRAAPRREVASAR